MTPEQWTAVDQFFDDALGTADPVLDDVLKANSDAGLPAIDVSANQAQLLSVMVQMSGAQRVLELGTLGGYSTIHLARAVGSTGRVVTLEVDPQHAKIARENFDRAGVADRIEVLLGDATDSLDQLITAESEPFDFVFLDADKRGYPAYLERIMKLIQPGTVIVADNVVRDGKVIDEDSTDPNVVGVRAFTKLLGKHEKVASAAVQTVGSKGWDGLTVSVVR